ncbi:head maturation protease, ClpP-related [Thermoactinomyces vulgaris]|jgi:ATP-dependent Clp protease, protease subunit|uniref:head maturation protease, ClpP-related n=1 Tax=Thermoactinomyces vulgaris TaxID=2026 RepID=UPI0011078544|nr:head maturation protease, ClpP-related [Thermoactinomyces vulgaris]QCV56266.1 Clp protease ClpP [Thermoactinomyces vulgaris]
MAKVKVKGTIVPNDVKEIYEWFGIDVTSPNDVSNVIEQLDGEEVEVEINSGGGDVYSGSEIYTSLKNYPGKVNVKITGIAASAASVIAMAGDRVQISPTAQIMIHNVSSTRSGDYRDMQHEAGILENYNKSIANAYMLKTGLSQEKLLEYMNKETWLNAQQAKELGFVDEIMFDEGNQLVASMTNGFVLPPQVISKIRNLLSTPSDGDQNKKLYQARLNFLKLKGEMKGEIR